MEDDKLVSRIKRKRKTSNDSIAIPKKFSRLTTDDDTESSSDDANGRQSPQPLRKQAQPPHKVISKVGGFFRKVSHSLRIKMKTKFSFKRKFFPKNQRTSAGNFTITNMRKEKKIVNGKGFQVEPLQSIG